MKYVILLILGTSLVAALALHLNHANPAPVSVAEQSPEPAQPTPDAAPPSRGPVAAPKTSATAAVERLAAAQPSPVPSAVTPAAVDPSFLNQAVDTLASPRVSYMQKQATWNQLREAGKLDQVIGTLEQRVAADPAKAETAAALGQAYLKKCGTIQDVREQGILAMQADKVFDSALSVDPWNWEARFTKAMAMTYWPPAMNKGDEVVQHFQTLIQQQEGVATQPNFAETYLWLGKFYQQTGHADEARTTWERGVTLFPDHAGLKAKLATPATP